MCDEKCWNRPWPRKSLVFLQSHRAKVWHGVTRWSHECTEAKVRRKRKTREKSQHNAMCNGNQVVGTRGQKHTEEARPIKERWAITNAMCDAKCWNRPWPRKSLLLLQSHRAKEVTRCDKVKPWMHRGECEKQDKDKRKEPSMCNGNQGVSIQGPRHREDARQRKSRRAIRNVMCDSKC